MNEIIKTLNDLNLYSIIFRIVLAMTVSGLLGIERGIKNRPAGLKTYMLVAVGACLVMLTGEYIFIKFDGKGGDPARMAAQVISGIGFLGAGTILVTSDNNIRGITTAASIWTSACIGIACGIGFYEGVIIGALSIFSIMFVFSKIDEKIKRTAHKINLNVEFKDYDYISELYDYFADKNINVQKTDVINKGENGDNAEVLFSIDYNGVFDEDIILSLESMPEVISVKSK